MFFRMVYKSRQIFLPFCHNTRVWRTDGQTCSAVKTDPWNVFRCRYNFTTSPTVFEPVRRVDANGDEVWFRAAAVSCRAADADTWSTSTQHGTAVWQWHSPTCKTRKFAPN